MTYETVTYETVGSLRIAVDENGNEIATIRRIGRRWYVRWTHGDWPCGSLKGSQLFIERNIAAGAKERKEQTK